MHAVVSAVEQKSCSARDGTEFPDYKLIIVDGIMVQYIVLLEQNRVIYKIIIHRVDYDGYVRIVDYVLQIYGIFIPRTWIDEFFWNSHFIILLYASSAISTIPAITMQRFNENTPSF